MPGDVILIVVRKHHLKGLLMPKTTTQQMFTTLYLTAIRGSCSSSDCVRNLKFSANPNTPTLHKYSKGDLSDYLHSHCRFFNR